MSQATTPVEDRIIAFTNLRTWAVVGASTDPEKYGNRIFRNLRRAGYTVYPVNPNAEEIEGVKVYPTLSDLPEMPDVVDIVVPPRVTERIVEEVKALGLTRVWMQPGAESEAAIRFCEENGIELIHSTCAMVHRRSWD